MVYVPTSSPADLDKPPVNVSLPTRAPLVTSYVNSGSESPYVLLTVSAVTSIDLDVISKLCDTLPLKTTLLGLTVAVTRYNPKLVGAVSPILV